MYEVTSHFDGDAAMHKTLIGSIAAVLMLSGDLSAQCIDAACDSVACDIDSCDAVSCDGYLTPALDPCDSPYLLGDWGGCRTALAEDGITFDADISNFYFGVVDGGTERTIRYAGHGDYVTNINFGALGIQEGLFLKLRAEHRFGESIGDATGAILPPTVLADLPVADSTELLLTNVLFTQALSEQFAVIFGKLDTLDGDMNAFAHGRGKSQFSNVGFVANPIALRTVPYSTLAAGFSILGEGFEPIFTFLALNPTDTASTSGFGELFSEGVTLNAELRLPTEFGGLPGHQLFAGTWSSREYTALDQDPRVLLPQIPINRADGSWSLYYNFDQYLSVDPCDKTKGWGVFGRAGIADDATNPISWLLSFGVGGNSPINGRSADTFGVGWYVAGTSGDLSNTLAPFLGPIGNGNVVEMYYNYEVTPWLHVTPDLQIIVPARDEVDTAILLGIRAVIEL